eukprot:m.65341 g.65341  ORF g.65341 m.65341 type:complete len:564 (+) comp11727_c0_seq2:75-1766(+)
MAARIPVLALLLLVFVSKNAAHSYRPAQVMPTLRASSFGLNVRDFGAIGDGKTDDSAAIQRAVDASQGQGRALMVPAGTYLVNKSIVVACSETECAVHANYSLRLVGEGQHIATIMAGQAMDCVLCFVADTDNKTHTLHTTTAHEVFDIGIHGNSLASYGIYAPAITRSQFEGVKIQENTIAGMYLGYGWINTVSRARFSGNAIGIKLISAVNAVYVLNSMFEGNHGIAIYVKSGCQITLANNCIEGNDGPGIMLVATRAVTMEGNYFEFNNVHPKPYNISGTNVTVCGDIVLNGASEDGILAHAYGSQSITIRGSYHNGQHSHANCPYFGNVLAVAVQGLTITGSNSGDRLMSPLVFMIPDESVTSVSDVTLTSNTGYGEIVHVEDSLASTLSALDLDSFQSPEDVSFMFPTAFDDQPVSGIKCKDKEIDLNFFQLLNCTIEPSSVFWLKGLTFTLQDFPIMANQTIYTLLATTTPGAQAWMRLCIDPGTGTKICPNFNHSIPSQQQHPQGLSKLMFQETIGDNITMPVHVYLETAADVPPSVLLSGVVMTNLGTKPYYTLS